MAKGKTNGAPPAPKSKKPKFELKVKHKRWPEPRTALYAADETVGAVAQRFAEQQGLPDRYTLEHEGEVLDLDMGIGILDPGSTVTLKELHQPEAAASEEADNEQDDEE